MIAIIVAMLLGCGQPHEHEHENTCRTEADRINAELHKEPCKESRK